MAAAQTGRHHDRRVSYGHAMIVDPWGKVIAQCSEGTGLCVAEVDLDYVEAVRNQVPCFGHRRSDLYTLASNFITGKGRLTFQTVEGYCSVPL